MLNKRVKIRFVAYDDFDRSIDVAKSKIAF